MLWYLTRDYNKGLVYDGTNLNDVLDGQDALKFKRDNPDFKTFTIPNLYGKPYHFRFPTYKLTRSDVTSPNSGWKDITYSWYEKVIELSNLGFINDYTLWAHKALTDNFDIFVKVQTWGEELYLLVQKEHVQIQEELESEDPDVVAQAMEKANQLKHPALKLQVKQGSSDTWEPLSWKTVIKTNHLEKTRPRRAGRKCPKPPFVSSEK